jgi:hypothetical protein
MPVKNATRRWKAEWIWHPEESGVRNSYYYLRKDFTVEDGGAARDIVRRDGKIKFFVCADTVYRLYLDGEAIGQGPLRSQSWNMYYDRYELELKPGAHCLGAEVYYQGAEGGNEALHGRGGFLLEAEDSTGSAIIATDVSWRILPAASWRRDGNSSG